MKFSGAALSLLAAIAASNPAFRVNANDETNSKMAGVLASNGMLALNGGLRGHATLDEDDGVSNSKSGGTFAESSLQEQRDESATSSNGKVGAITGESLLPGLRNGDLPSSQPSSQPSASPSTNFPSFTPSTTIGPTPSPTETAQPSPQPTLITESPRPSPSPSLEPSKTVYPSSSPSFSPSVIPTVAASEVPSSMPTKAPTPFPSSSPTRSISPSSSVAPSPGTLLI